MKKYKLRDLTLLEKENKLKTLEEELIKLTFRHKNRQLDKVMRLREVKRDITRLKTYIHQTYMAAQEGQDV